MTETFSVMSESFTTNANAKSLKVDSRTHPYVSAVLEHPITRLVKIKWLGFCRDFSHLSNAKLWFMKSWNHQNFVRTLSNLFDVNFRQRLIYLFQNIFLKLPMTFFLFIVTQHHNVLVLVNFCWTWNKYLKNFLMGFNWCWKYLKYLFFASVTVKNFLMLCIELLFSFLTLMDLTTAE